MAALRKDYKKIDIQRELQVVDLTNGGKIQPYVKGLQIENELNKVMNYYDSLFMSHRINRFLRREIHLQIMSKIIQKPQRKKNNGHQSPKIFLNSRSSNKTITAPLSGATCFKNH